MKKFLKIFALAFAIVFIKSFSFASNGIILNTDNTLDYYEDDIYVKTLRELEHSNYQIYNSGLYYFLLEDKENRYFINKCEIKTNKCVSFHTPYGRFGVLDFQLFDNGTGFVLTKNGKVDFYIKNKFIKTLKISNLDVPSISYSGNALYFIEHGEDYRHFSYFYLNKCLLNGTECKIINTIEANYGTGNVSYLSFRENSKGFVMTEKGNTFYYENDKQETAAGPDQNDFIKKIMYTTDALYIFNMPYPEDKIPNFIVKCDSVGNNCVNITLNNPTPQKASYH